MHLVFRTLILISLVGFISIKSSQTDTVKINQDEKFLRGEKLKYRAHYGFFSAAEATVQLDTLLHQVKSHTCYKVDIDAKTVGGFAAFYDVDNLYRSYIDTSQIIPHKFYRNISENRYKLEETIQFDHNSEKAKVHQNKKGKIKEKEYKLPRHAQDLVSGYYYLRTIDFDGAIEGDTIRMNAFFEDEAYDFKILYLGKKEIKTKFGKVPSIEMAPIMPDNKIFRGENSIKFWVSDDINRVPLKIRAKLFVGAFEVELTEYEGLRADIGKGNKN